MVDFDDLRLCFLPFYHYFDLLYVINLFPIFLGFGGGFVAPMMLGKPPAPIANDAVIPFVLVAW